jgi:ABC-type Fe3+ transport system permease subunit
MNAGDIERHWAQRASRYLKAELKRADVTYEELAKRLNAKGWEETTASITNKLARGTFAATFFLAALEALEMSGVRLEDI